MAKVRQDFTVHRSAVRTRSRLDSEDQHRNLFRNLSQERKRLSTKCKVIGNRTTTNASRPGWRTYSDAGGLILHIYSPSLIRRDMQWLLLVPRLDIFQTYRKPSLCCKAFSAKKTSKQEEKLFGKFELAHRSHQIHGPKRTREEQVRCFNKKNTY